MPPARITDCAPIALEGMSDRERKRLRIVEEGGQATVRMLLPVALFIMPVLFVVLLVPAGMLSPR